MIAGKATKYKLFWIGSDSGFGGVGILLAEKWIDKVIDVNRVNDRIILIKLMVQESILSVISVYAPQCGLDDVQKDRFYDSLINIAGKLGEKEIVVIAGDFNGHVGKSINGYDSLHGGYGYGDRNKEGERILEFCAAMDMIVANTFFKKRDSHLVTYESGSAKTQVDYCLVRKDQRKLLKDIKVIPSEECIAQHKPVICNLKIKKVKSTRRRFVPRRKIWKLHESSVKSDFSLYVREFREGHNTTPSVEGYWKVLKESLLDAAERTCGWTKGPSRHKETWWWSSDVDSAVKEKRKLWKDWKEGEIEKELYLEAKRNSKRAVYKAKCEAEKNRFADVENRK